jgi:hypothetical protein
MEQVEQDNESEWLEIKHTDFPSLEITVKMYDTRARKETGGQGLMTFMAFCTDVGEKGDKRIGSIGGGVGSVTVSVGDDHFFMIKHDDLWYAVQEALQNAQWQYPEDWGKYAKEE